MKPISVKVLLIEDDEDDVLLIRQYLAEVENFKFEVYWEPDLTLAKRKMIQEDFHVFLIDYRLGGENGLDLIKYAQEKEVLTPSIILTGHGDLKIDIDASSSGAADYLVKTDLNSSMLERSIRYALSHSKIIKELDEKEKKYRTLFERSIDPIFLANSHFVLMDVNNSFKSFFGPAVLGEELHVGKMFAYENDFLYFTSTLKEIGQVKDFEVSLVSKNGINKVCLLNCGYIPDQTSELPCYQGIIYDLTILKQAANDMLVAERLSLTGKMARTIAHEVRNPLTNLNLALDQLRGELPADNEAIKLYGDIIERNANRIEQLVGDMLNSSRPKQLHLELTEVSEVMDSTLRMAMDRIMLHQIELKTMYQKDLPRVLMDKEKIQIALLNIVVNAVEAMTPGKGILKIETNLQDRILKLMITDNGKGIPAADLGRLFDPFFTSKHSGMGLGLTSTKNILNSHNAQIEVNSEINKGTVFCIEFKLVD